MKFRVKKVHNKIDNNSNNSSNNCLLEYLLCARHCVSYFMRIEKHLYNNSLLYYQEALTDIKFLTCGITSKLQISIHMKFFSFKFSKKNGVPMCQCALLCIISRQGLPWLAILESCSLISVRVLKSVRREATMMSPLQRNEPRMNKRICRSLHDLDIKAAPEWMIVRCFHSLSVKPTTGISALLHQFNYEMACLQSILIFPLLKCEACNFRICLI